MKHNRHRKAPRPLDPDGLNRIALHYVGRYATTRSKLAMYLRRKVLERGWDHDTAADVDAIVTRCAALGYVDDQAFATMRAGSLARRGYGARRISQALRGAGIDQDVATSVMPDEDAATVAAETYARRKRIGPFADGVIDKVQRQKQLAAMIRAGHSFALARHFAHADPCEFPDCSEP